MASRPSREAVAAALRKTYPEHLRKSSDGQMLGDADAFLAALPSEPPSDPERLDALRPLSDAAQPGEWASGGDEVYAHGPDLYADICRMAGDAPEADNNADFIAAAVNLVRAALAEEPHGQ